jgi:N-acetylmuramoyl-L-alanine amidase
MAHKQFLNPGHGGKDSGAVGYGLKEKDLNLDMSLRTAKGLEAYPFQTFLNRTTDRFDSISTICAKANASGAESFLAQHCNWTGTSPHGFEEVYVSSAGRRLCDVINGRLAPLNPGRNVGPYADRRGLGVLRGTRMPAAVIEYLGVSVGAEAALLSDPAFRQNCADATVAGLCDYFGEAYHGPAARPVTPNNPVPINPPQPAPPTGSHPAWPGTVFHARMDRNGNYLGAVNYGEALKPWQRRMVERGWDLGKTGPNHDGVDGWFGRTCHDKLGLFQTEKRLTHDHLLGVNSWNAAWTSPVT